MNMKRDRDKIVFQLQHSTNMQMLIVLNKYIKANVTTHLKALFKSIHEYFL